MENENKRSRGRPPKQGSLAAGHRISCTPEQWAALEKMADDQKISISRLIMKLAQIGAFFTLVSCTSKSSYFPNGSDLSETNSKDKTTHYAKTHRRRTKRRGPSSKASQTDLSSRFFLGPLDTVHLYSLSESSVGAIYGVKK